MKRWIVMAMLAVAASAGCAGGTVHVHVRDTAPGRLVETSPRCRVDVDDKPPEASAPRTIDVTTRRTTRVIDRRICLTD